jgi:hypothetical protein
MHFGLFRAIPIIGPNHGQGGIDQRTVDRNEISESGHVLGDGKLGRRLFLQMLINMNHLLQAPRVEGLEESTFLNPAGRSDVGGGKIFLGQDLKQVPPRRMLFEVVIGQDFQLVLKGHLQRSVAASLKGRTMVERGLERVEQSGDAASVEPGAK